MVGVGYNSARCWLGVSVAAGPSGEQQWWGTLVTGVTTVVTTATCQSAHPSLQSWHLAGETFSDLKYPHWLDTGWDGACCECWMVSLLLTFAGVICLPMAHDMDPELWRTVVQWFSRNSRYVICIYATSWSTILVSAENYSQCIKSIFIGNNSSHESWITLTTQSRGPRLDLCSGLRLRVILGEVGVGVVQSCARLRCVVLLGGWTLDLQTAMLRHYSLVCRHSAFPPQQTNNQSNF